MRLSVLDTTFRDGLQARGVEATSLNDALKAVEAIDRLGVEYVELGFALGNPFAQELIERALSMDLRAKVAAFGRTHVKDVEAILNLEVPVAVLVAKSRRFDVEVALGKDANEYLAEVAEFVGLLVNSGVEVIFDAEHFFDSMAMSGDDFALQLLQTAHQAGASTLVLCDTNGGSRPCHVAHSVMEVQKWLPSASLGIHTHDDRGRALANAEAAIGLGVTHVQGTIGGIGERVGNMDLCSLLPNTHLDLGMIWPDADCLSHLKATYLIVCDALNLSPDSHHPWVGESAFYTEAGMHQSGQSRVPGSYLHWDPTLVGNRESVGVSSQSGRANIQFKALEFGLEILGSQVAEIARRHDELVSCGWDFGLADASLRLFFLRCLDRLPDFFGQCSYDVTGRRQQGEVVSEAVVKVKSSQGTSQMAVSNGDGLIDALNQALRQVLVPAHPKLSRVQLRDYKVRIITMGGTASSVRALVEFTDGQKVWTTVGVHESIVEASFQALMDAYVYELVVNGSGG